MKQDVKLLMITYIFSGSLELAMVLSLYGKDSGVLLPYLFLLLTTLVSIPMENSAMGEQLREEMGALGALTIRYDTMCNFLRSAIYLFTFGGLFSLETGALLAIGAMFFFGLLTVLKVIGKGGGQNQQPEGKEEDEEKK